jgi:hypothetical protein
MTLLWENETKALLSQPYTVVDVYDDGTAGANEVSRVRLADGREVVLKVMLSTKIYHQRRKAITEVAFASLDEGIGGDRVCPNLYADLFRITPEYAQYWGKVNKERNERMCSVIREFCVGLSGQDWRGSVYSQTQDLPRADRIIKAHIESSPSAERMSLLDFVTINQDRSARNWVYDPIAKKFWAIDNGMAWFHEYPETDSWKQGCVIDDVILQKGDYRFISGVFTTLWAGRPISPDLMNRLQQFNSNKFLRNIAHGSYNLGFPPEMASDWRFEGLLRRLAWITEKGRQPTAEEYREWHKGSSLMTPPEIVETGGKVVWQIDWDFKKMDELLS